MMHGLYVFTQLFRRDCYVHTQSIGNYLINYAILYPIIYTLMTAYFQANTYFNTIDPKAGTLLFCGNVVIMLMILSFINHIDILYDVEGPKYVDFQLTFCSAFTLIMERIIFYGLFTFILMAPFFPVSKLILPAYIDTSHTSWPAVMIILFLASFWCSAYQLMAICLLQSTDSIISFWKRANVPLMDFGGMWIPWYIMYTYSPFLGYAAYLNPLMYVTDGLKQALVGGPEFFAISTCIVALTGFTILCSLLAWVIFKKRVDCL